MCNDYNFSVITASGEIIVENGSLEKQVINEIIHNKLFYTVNRKVRIINKESYVYPLFENNGSLSGYIIIELPQKYELDVMISYLLDKLIQINFRQLLNSKKNRDIKYDEYNLTNKEKKVIELISKGKTDDEIAVLCFCTKSTIRKNISSIFLKVGYRRRVDLVRFYYENIYFYNEKSEQSN